MVALPRTVVMGILLKLILSRCRPSFNSLTRCFKSSPGKSQSQTENVQIREWTPNDKKTTSTTKRPQNENKITKQNAKGQNKIHKDQNYKNYQKGQQKISTSGFVYASVHRLQASSRRTSSRTTTTKNAAECHGCLLYTSPSPRD